MGRDGRSAAGGRTAVGIINDKYVVFKRVEWEAAESPMEYGNVEELPDAVVIRLQDVFAEGALWTYANEIRAALDVVKWLGATGPSIDRLYEIAEYFSTMAVKAGEFGKKVPD